MIGVCHKLDDRFTKILDKSILLEISLLICSSFVLGAWCVQVLHCDMYNIVVMEPLEAVLRGYYLFLIILLLYTTSRQCDE